MQIERVYFQKNFQVGDFLYEHIGVGISLEAGESAKEALETAMQFAKEQHFEKHKEMYAQMGGKVIDVNSIEKPLFKQPMDEIIKAIYNKAVRDNDTDTITKIESDYDVTVI